MRRPDPAMTGIDLSNDVSDVVYARHPQLIARAAREPLARRIRDISQLGTIGALIVTAVTASPIAAIVTAVGYLAAQATAQVIDERAEAAATKLRDIIRDEYGLRMDDIREDKVIVSITPDHLIRRPVAA
ncbi:hypothetical protein [Microbacterium sp. 77mftsu3.1]|uniref:hypothetical protein n=1 Tax=Microbacterium sp. 77mftsu3.1 TaxID=1761802 RepID=UPI00088861B6|nr:hypothetical protein [Microbacterium sp. 77mftsu3.1]SDH41454.1 hypothetical protein SAMN04488590_3281 [Microbacterium sp. 77mftsu3.1]